MVHFAAPVLLFAVIVFAGGCQLCCPPYMDDYATVGGKWARANPPDGRTGSAFSDPGVIQASGASTMTMDWNHSEGQPSPVMDYPQDSVLEEADDWNNPLREGRGSSIILLE